MVLLLPELWKAEQGEHCRGIYQGATEGSAPDRERNDGALQENSRRFRRGCGIRDAILQEGRRREPDGLRVSVRFAKACGRLGCDARRCADRHEVHQLHETRADRSQGIREASAREAQVNVAAARRHWTLASTDISNRLWGSYRHQSMAGCTSSRFVQRPLPECRFLTPPAYTPARVPARPIRRWISL